MRTLIFILLLFSFCANAQTGIRAGQVKGKTDVHNLYIMGTDTTTGSNTLGFGKWLPKSGLFTIDSVFTVSDSICVSIAGDSIAATCALIPWAGCGVIDTAYENVAMDTLFILFCSGDTLAFTTSTLGFLGINSVEGVVNAAGNIDLVEGYGIDIAGNDGANTITFTIDTSQLSTPYDITQIPISSLKAAIAANTIHNANYNQVWNWNSLTSGTGLKIASTSTGASANAQTLFWVDLSGANATASQTTWAGYFSNTHTGTTPTNNGLVGIQSGLGTGVFGAANTTGTGVYGSSSSGIGIQAYSASSIGLKAMSETSLPLSVHALTNTATNAVVPVSKFYANSSGTAAAGFGTSLEFYSESSTTNDTKAGSIKYPWAIATHASRSSSFVASILGNAAEYDAMTITGSATTATNGRVTLGKYGLGNITGTPVYNLQVDASGNVVESSVPVGASNITEEGDALVQSGTVTYDFQSMFDVTTTGTTEANIFWDGGEATTIFATEDDEFVHIYDSGAGGFPLNSIGNKKIAVSDFITAIGAGNGIYGGDGTCPADVDVTLTDHIDFDGTTLFVDGPLNSVGFGTGTPDVQVDIESTSANLRVYDTNGGSGNQLILQTNVSATGLGPFGGISMQFEDPAATVVDAWDIEGNRREDAVNNTTLSIIANQNTAARVFVGEKNVNFSGNTTESHISMNGGIAHTQNYEWTGTGADLTLDRSYNIVNVSGSGAIGDEIFLPEVASTSDNWDSTISSAQVQVGQEYTITNFRAATNLTIVVFSGDQINAASATTKTLLPTESVIVKCVRFSGGTGYWKTY